MRRLEDEFQEYLNDEGVIRIAGESFSRHEILQGLAPEPYEIAFSDWVSQRKDRLLETADEILSRYDNEDRFRQLQQVYRAASLRPFVGAGLSMSSGYPGWSAFLLRICGESHVESITLQSMLNEGKYEEAAQVLSDDIGANGFDEAVQATFGRERNPFGAVTILPQCFATGAVFTTNFDGVLEKTFNAEPSHGFDRVIAGSAIAEVPRHLAAGARILVKMHGDCQNVAGRVLTQQEYESFYGDDKVARDWFLRVIFGNSLLFLGCSLVSDRTIYWMSRIVEEHSKASLPRHYAFIELNERIDRIQRKKELAKANIFPIWYEQVDHDEAIEALLLKLRNSE